MPPDLNARIIKSLKAASDNARIKLALVEVDRPDEIGAALRQITGSSVQGILVQFSPALLDSRQHIFDYVNARRLPAMYGDALYVEEGGLIFYGTPYVDLARRAAGIVAKIVRGTKPGDIPVESPTEVKLIINRTTAKALGVIIPRSILIRAEFVAGG
jgi:putative ABC transport system substrate-binding protein